MSILRRSTAALLAVLLVLLAALPVAAADPGRTADAVVVGSAIVRMIGQLGDAPDMPAKVGAFVRTLADAAKARARG